MFRWTPTKIPQEITFPRTSSEKFTEGLTGTIRGDAATDIEERMYIAFLNNGIKDADIQFQPSYIAGRRVPGEIRPDFATYQSSLIMIWYADADYWHRSAEQRKKDETNDAILFQRMEGRIEFPIRIPGSELDTQRNADRAIAEEL
jgi:hypothetical protein